MAAILMIAYIAAAYWATNKIWWSKKVYVYPFPARRLPPLRWEMNCVCYSLDIAL